MLSFSHFLTEAKDGSLIVFFTKTVAIALGQIAEMIS
jgi:hypothetical protein